MQDFKAIAVRLFEILEDEHMNAAKMVSDKMDPHDFNALRDAVLEARLTWED